MTNSFMYRIALPLIRFFMRYSMVIIILLFIIASLWIFFDARIMRRKNRRGLPPWVWLLSFFGGGLWIPPIYWLVRKPRSISRFFIAVFVLWILPFSIPLGSHFLRSRIAEERELKISELKIGMTMNAISEYIGEPSYIDTTFSEELHRDIVEWNYNITIRKGWYTLNFTDSILKSIKFTESPMNKRK